MLLAWLEKHTGEAAGELHCVMEATGIYHEGLAYALHEAGARVSVVNPAQLREYAKSLGTRTKTDKKDALQNRPTAAPEGAAVVCSLCCFLLSGYANQPQQTATEQPCRSRYRYSCCKDT